ncbi:hypothetical protein C5167_040345 [Papaver somniferum]|uniref:PROP1-like PPR domain-containing protein n=1 Tax=Papaver somniferum TaxID=3469 RepID=A0A4Y7IEV4_PAPSO|nr:pentatricopeptide repeat-containing protein CRP1, chloroplastic-like [Papaver somniferum]RZC47404.1 hypothetical protein C5167_040345 [Papaver somniferum]
MRPFLVSKRKSIINLIRQQSRLLSTIRSTSSNTNPPPSTEIFNFNISSSNLITRNPKFSTPISLRSIHAQAIASADDENDLRVDSEDDNAMTEFLSRFVWIMRAKLTEAYPDSDKRVINDMLLLIVEKVVSELEIGGLGSMIVAAESDMSEDFSADLWKTVWEVSNSVLGDMQNEKKKDEMKRFLQCEEVRDMTRFASEIGVRGDMLREMRFKWAKEKMEESEFYQNFEIEDENVAGEVAVEEGVDVVGDGDDNVDGAAAGEIKPNVVSIPQRKGKIKYKIYGLDMSDTKWAEAADKYHEAEKLMFDEEPKKITGKCKLINEKILSLNVEDDPSALLAEWIELLQPRRVDWLTLLEKLKERNLGLYLKMAELILNEESFQANIRDYSKLIDTHYKDNRLEDAERVLKKMTDKGIEPDILTSIILVHMYSKINNLERAQEAFDSLKIQGFQPDTKVYNSLVMGYIKARQADVAENLIKDMETRDIKPTRDMLIALLRSFSERGEAVRAQSTSTCMILAGYQPDLEYYTSLVGAYGPSDPEHAREIFNKMRKAGIKPDDKCTANMMAGYEKKNCLDKALNLLLELEKDGFEPGFETYSVLVDWLAHLQLVDECEELLRKITEKGDVPPLKVHVSLCAMYSKEGDKKKALQALGVVEDKKDLLGADEFERIIDGLIAGGLTSDAERILKVMEAQGFPASQRLKVSLMGSAFLPRRSKPKLNF